MNKNLLVGLLQVACGSTLAVIGGKTVISSLTPQAPAAIGTKQIIDEDDIELVDED